MSAQIGGRSGQGGLRAHKLRERARLTARRRARARRDDAHLDKHGHGVAEGGGVGAAVTA